MEFMVFWCKHHVSEGVNIITIINFINTTTTINATLLADIVLITRACCLQVDRHRGPEPASLQAGRCVIAATRVAPETCWGAGQEVGAPAEAGGDCPASGCQKVCQPYDLLYNIAVWKKRAGICYRTLQFV